MLCLQDECGKRLEGAHGELVLDVEQGTIFSVSQYRGQPGLGYFCLEAEKAAKKEGAWYCKDCTLGSGRAWT